MSFEAMWLEYASRVIPADAPWIQRQEMRRSFYAGALVILGELERIAETTPDESEDGLVEGAQRIETMRQEVIGTLLGMVEGARQ